MEFLKESVDYAFFFSLGLMGFVSIWLTIERVMFLRKVNPSDYPTKDEYDAALTNNLTTLYIIYSNAPYVGLLGTVIGPVREHQCFGHHDGPFIGSEGDGFGPHSRYPDAHLL